jgi:two-component system response regulator PilR (NtrC family)
VRPGLPVAVITAFGSIETAIRALKRAPSTSSPSRSNSRLRELVQHALSLRAVAAPRRCSAAGTERSLHRAILELPSCTCARSREAGAQPGAGVHHGESGTGKELMAR